MEDSDMPSSHHHFPTKRSSPTLDHSHHFKRARLEYILCDSGRSSIFSIPLDSLVDVPASPSDPASVFVALTEPSTLPSTCSPSAAASLAAHLVDKFTKSRAVGQSHRDNEKEHVKALRMDVEKCRDENILLFALFSASYKLEHCKPLPLRLIADVHARLAHDRPEDYTVLTDHEAARHGFVKLSKATAHLLEQRYMSPALAVVLLDFVIYRRNVVSVATDASEAGYRRRRRRSAYRIALSRASAQEVVSFAVNLFAKEDRGNEDIYRFIDRRLGSLSVLLDRWSEAEAHNNHHENPIEASDSDSDEPEYPPGSPTCPEAAEFGSPPRRRGEGAKRCSRCNMVKFTGSGHGRSKCDDGYSISSRVPYRPMPSSPGSECTSEDVGTESSIFSN